jgi:hypothetical protein
VSAEIGSLEVVGGFGGKGTTLAEGLMYSGDPAQYKKDLAELAALTPAQIKAATGRWMKRPVLAIAVTPGERTQKGDQLGGWGDEATRPAPSPTPRRPCPPSRNPRAKRPTLRRWAIWPSPRFSTQRCPTASGHAGPPHRRAQVLVSIGFDAGVAADRSTRRARRA